jgi:hypothetical protein
VSGPPWAEYLTFVATAIFVPYEIHELAKNVSALKVVALVINLAIVAYLLIDKRLFGLRGGDRAERAEHEENTGWAPIERATPVPLVPQAGLTDQGTTYGHRRLLGGQPPRRPDVQVRCLS